MPLGPYKPTTAIKNKSFLPRERSTRNFQYPAGSAGGPRASDGMDLLGGLSGPPRHRILTGRIRARTRDRQMIIWPTPRGRKSASVKECDGRLGTPDKTPGDLFSSFGIPSPPLCVQARPAESSGCGRGRRACGRAAQPPSRPPAHLRIPRLRRLAARAYHAPAPAADSRSDFGVAFPRATGRCCGKKCVIAIPDTETLFPGLRQTIPLNPHRALYRNPVLSEYYYAR